MLNPISAILLSLRHRILRLSALLTISISCCAHADLHSIIDADNLIVGVINDEHHHRFTRHGHVGLDAELAKGFAEYLDVELSIVPFYSEQALIQALAQQRIHIAAPRFSALVSDASLVSGPEFFSSPLMVIRRHDSQHACLTAPPQQRLISDDLLTIAQSASQTGWQSSDKVDTSSLLTSVANNNSECTLLPKHTFDKDSDKYPQLTASDLHDLLNTQESSQQVNVTKRWWLLPEHVTLRSSVFEYVHLRRQRGELIDITGLESHYPSSPDNIKANDFVVDVENTLPQLQPLFEREAAVLPWQSIAAIDYFESQWRSSAALTEAADAFKRATGRNDFQPVEQRINKINQQLEWLDRQLPARIKGVDRNWLLIAAYHSGLAHIEDARQLASEAGANPDLWINVKQHLARLSLPVHYRRSDYGYINGKETLEFVDKVRFFTDSLNVVHDGAQGQVEEPPGAEH